MHLSFDNAEYISPKAGLAAAVVYLFDNIAIKFAQHQIEFANNIVKQLQVHFIGELRNIPLNSVVTVHFIQYLRP